MGAAEVETFLKHLDHGAHGTIEHRHAVLQNFRQLGGAGIGWGLHRPKIVGQPRAAPRLSAGQSPVIFRYCLGLLGRKTCLSSSFF